MKGMDSMEKKTLVEVLKETRDSLRFNEQGRAIIVMVHHGKEAKKQYASLQDYKMIKTLDYVLTLEPKEKHQKTIAEKVQAKLAKV